jgi:peroxiredoxin
MRSFLLAAALLLPAQAGAEIHTAPENVRPLLPGMAASAFRLLDVDGNRLDIDPASLDKPVVLTFYRGGWCPYCNLHLAELRNTEEALRKMGYEVWFISPDRPELLSEGSDSEFDYRLFSDPEMNAAQAFGIAFRVDDATNARYLGAGIDLNARAGGRLQALPAPATFIVGTDGRIRFAYVNPDYTVRLAPEVLEAAARAHAQGADARLRRSRTD